VRRGTLPLRMHLGIVICSNERVVHSMVCGIRCPAETS
jgi:hypothetical protein